MGCKIKINLADKQQDKNQSVESQPMFCTLYDKQDLKILSFDLFYPVLLMFCFQFNFLQSIFFTICFLLLFLSTLTAFRCRRPTPSFYYFKIKKSFLSVLNSVQNSHRSTSDFPDLSPIFDPISFQFLNTSQFSPIF